MRLLLLIAVIALGIDALYFSGSYTQAAFRETSSAIQRLSAGVRQGGRDEQRPAERQDYRDGASTNGAQR